LGYKYTLKNNDSSGCAPSTYSVVPTLPSGWTQTPSSFTESLAPGASVIRDINITSPVTVTSGSYTISEKATNTANSSLNSTASFVNSVTSTVTGFSILSSSASVTASSITVSWITSTPSTGSVLLMGGATVSDPATGTTHTATLTGLSKSTQYTYTISATDADGTVITKTGKVRTKSR
jgi:phosphodiesterase/alkaline phosphatase D-like protein